MSRISASRISHLAHLVVDALRTSGLADLPNQRHALAETKQALSDFFQAEDHIDEIARQKIQSLSRYIPLGSREWDILYRKYFEEEMRKHRK